VHLAFYSPMLPDCKHYLCVVCSVHFSNSLARSRSRSLTKKCRPVGESSRKIRSHNPAKRNSGSPSLHRASKRGPRTPPAGSPQRKKRPSRSGVKEEGRSHPTSQSRSPERTRSTSPPHHRDSKGGPRTPPTASPQRKNHPGRSRSPVREESARHRSHSSTPARSGSESPLKKPVSSSGPQTPTNEHRRRDRRSQFPARGRSPSPVTDGNMNKDADTSPAGGRAECDNVSHSPLRDASPHHSLERKDRSPRHSRPVKNGSHSPSPQSSGRRGPHTPPSPSAVQRSSHSRSPSPR